MGAAEHVRWLVAALTAINDEGCDMGDDVDLIGHLDAPTAAATPEFVTAAALLAHFLVGGVCYYSGQDVPAVLRELGAWAAHLPEG